MNSTSNPFNVKLRKVPGPSPSQRPKNQWKVNSKPLPTNNDGPPFTLLGSDNPELVFGVVLRPIQTTAAPSRESEVGEKRYLDLDFNGGERQDGPPFAQEGSVEQETFGFPFGVRLKPTRRPYDQQSLNRTYQIDLNPPPLKIGSNNNTYHHSRPQSLLEIELRPVDERNTNNYGNNAAAPEFVMLQLRHVVAPPDGGPRRAVTEALLQIPLLRKVVPNRNKSNSDNPLERLLQLAIQSLKHVTPNQHKGSSSESSELLQIRLRHVDPESQQTHDMIEAIDLALLKPVSQQQNPTKGQSMQVTLRHVQPNNNSHTNDEGSSSPEFTNIQLKSVHWKEEEEQVDDDDNHIDDDDEVGNAATAAADDDDDDDDDDLKDSNISEGDESQEEQSLADCIEAADTTSAAEKEDLEGKLQSSLPNIELHKDDMSATALLEDNNDDDDDHALRRKVSRRDTLPVAPQRQRSRSLNDMNSMARTTTERNKQAELSLSDPKRRDLLLWYHRLKAPTMEEMKRRVAKLPQSCDITPEDVELLPWRCNGRFLDVRTMNRHFLENWQGAEEQKTSDDGDDEKDSSDSTSDNDSV